MPNHLSCEAGVIGDSLLTGELIIFIKQSILVIVHVVEIG